MKWRFVFACSLTVAIAGLSFSANASADENSIQNEAPSVYLDTPYPGTPVHLDSRGDEVKAVQVQLNADGYPVGAADGVFGPQTLKRVRQFQAVHHLRGDGIVGPHTWGTLFPTAPTVLLARIQKYLNPRSSTVSVAVYDVNDDKTEVLNPYITFDTASIVKPLILATLLRDSELQQTSFSQWEQQMAVSMIEQSNNDDATRLWNLAGSGAGVRAFTDAANMNATLPNTAGYWGLTTTTAMDQVALIKNFVFPNSLLDSSDRQFVLSLMHQVTPWQRWGISAGVPETAYVALKNGWLPLQDGDWEINSIGYVRGDGRNYVIAVLTRGNVTEQYGISTIEGISRIAWATLGV